MNEITNSKTHMTYYLQRYIIIIITTVQCKYIWQCHWQPTLIAREIKNLFPCPKVINQVLKYSSPRTESLNEKIYIYSVRRKKKKEYLVKMKNIDLELIWDSNYTTPQVFNFFQSCSSKLLTLSIKCVNSQFQLSLHGFFLLASC